MTGRKIISLATFGAVAMAISCANTRRKVKAIFNDRGGSSSRVPVCQCNSVTVYHPPVVTLQLMQILHQIVTNYECHGQPRPAQATTLRHNNWQESGVIALMSSVRLLGSEHKNMQISACLWCDDLAGYLQRDRAAVCRHVLTRHRTVTRRLHNINIQYCIIKMILILYHHTIPTACPVCLVPKQRLI